MRNHIYWLYCTGLLHPIVIEDATVITTDIDVQLLVTFLPMGELSEFLLTENLL